MLKQQDQAFLQGAHEVVSRADSRASESPPSRWAPQTGKSGKTRNEEKCVMPQWRPSITDTSSRRWGRWGHRAGERHQRQHPLILQPRVPYSSELRLSLPNRASCLSCSVPTFSGNRETWRPPSIWHLSTSVLPENPPCMPVFISILNPHPPCPSHWGHRYLDWLLQAC